jgi:hypothetical protein
MQIEFLNFGPDHWGKSECVGSWSSLDEFPGVRGKAASDQSDSRLRLQGVSEKVQKAEGGLIYMTQQNMVARKLQRSSNVELRG